MGSAEGYMAAGEPVVADPSARELGVFEADIAAGEPTEVDLCAGELGLVEADISADELGHGEADLAPGELGLVEVDLPAGDRATHEADLATGETWRRGRPTPPPEQRVLPKLTFAPENLASTNRDLPDGEPGSLEADLALGELSAVEADCRAGEPGFFEADLATEELGVVEAHHPAGERGLLREIPAVEDDAGEVEILAPPRRRGTVAQMLGDDPDGGVANFPVSKKRQVPRSVPLPRIRRVWHAQVTTQDVDTGLTVFLPVIGQPRHGVNAGKPDG